MKVAKGYKKQVVKLAALIGYTAPKTASAVMAWLDAQDEAQRIVARLKAEVANDNEQVISGHLVEQLNDLIRFIAKRKNCSVDVMIAELGLTMGVGHLGRLKDSQFKAALDYVLMYRAA